MKKILTLLIMLIFSASSYALELARTTASSLNVRSSPGGEIIHTLPKGSIVSPQQIQDQWVMILYMPKSPPATAKTGWVDIDYIEMVRKQPGSGGQRTITGDDCQWEYDSDSRVCLTITDTSFDCDETFDRTSYSSCEVGVEYSLETTYTGDDYLDVGVECSASIDYQERDSYLSKSDSDNDDDSHSLYGYD